MARSLKSRWIAGAVLMAGFDVYQAVSNFRKGNKGIAFLYLSSAAIGGFAVGALLMSCTGIGILLVALLILSLTLPPSSASNAFVSAAKNLKE